MPVRIGYVTAAHLHVYSYAHPLAASPLSEPVGVWDFEPERGRAFAERIKLPFFETYEALLAEVDAVAIVSENKRHAEHVETAARAGKAILCEKPLATTEEEATRIERAVAESGVVFMTAFPCRYSPAYQRLKQRVQAGDIGAIRAICATNHGSCPFGWFVEPEKSGGGAMVDHVVHVMDLLRDLLGEEASRVQAQIGHNRFEQAWDDTAMVTVEFPSGIFATIDSSWSRPGPYKTWGDVTMNVVGENGVIELDMFGQAIDRYAPGEKTHTSVGFGSDLDGLLCDDFLRCVLGERPVSVTVRDGLQASRVAMAAYASVGAGTAALQSGIPTPAGRRGDTGADAAGDGGTTG